MLGKGQRNASEWQVSEMAPYWETRSFLEVAVQLLLTVSVKILEICICTNHLTSHQIDTDCLPRLNNEGTKSEKQFSLYTSQDL